MDLAAPTFPPVPTLVRRVLAIALGLLVGPERERRGHEAGVRTFALSAAHGCIGGLMGDANAVMKPGVGRRDRRPHGGAGHRARRAHGAHPVRRAPPYDVHGRASRVAAGGMGAAQRWSWQAAAGIRSWPTAQPSGSAGLPG